MIEKILNEDGTEYDPPRNPLEEKWEKLYPSCGSGGYKCMYCGKCPHGEYWKVPEEDKDDWVAYMMTVHQYDIDHGNVINEIHRERLRQMIRDTKGYLERIAYEKIKNLH